MKPHRRPAFVVALVVLASVLLPGAGVTQEQEEALRKKVLLIGLDGVRVDIMARVETPVIDSLAAGGFFSDEAKTRVRTVSGPGWSSMTIGARTDKHLVDGNTYDDDGCDSSCVLEDGFDCDSSGEPTTCTASCGSEREQGALQPDVVEIGVTLACPS